jgi:MFS family permease
MTLLGRRFFFIAAGAGFVFTNMAVAVPLHVVSVHENAAVAGNVLATSTVAIAFGAAAAGAIGARLRGGPRMLAAALVTVGAGAAILAVAFELVLLTLGAAVVGFGIGLFWVASQLILSRHAGRPGSADGFLHHYASYTAGGVIGSVLTGASAGLFRRGGLTSLDGIHASSALAALVACVCVALWRPMAHAVEEPRQPDAPRVRTFALQVPDLLLVGALALLLPLAPVVLARDFRLTPFSIGLVMAGVAMSKIAGTVVARLLTGASTMRRTIFLLLAGGAAFCLLLCAALTVSVFVMLLFATALLTTGAWPLVVASAQARVEPEARRSLTVAWNTREYVLIATMTALSGFLLSRLGSSAPLFVLAALMFGLAAASVALPRLRHA